MPDLAELAARITAFFEEAWQRIYAFVRGVSELLAAMGAELLDMLRQREARIATLERRLVILNVVQDSLREALGGTYVGRDE